MDIATLKTIQKNFTKELQNAKEGKKSSLSFITHQLPAFALVKENDIFQVLVIGGSISKNALIKKTGNNIDILSDKQKDQPPFTTKAAFLAFVEKELVPEISVLAVNFAYPLVPIYTGQKLEGVFIAGSKENTFDGMKEKNVCREIEEYVLQKKNKHISVTIANDSICLLLSGLTENSWNHLACSIIGTGLGAALFLDKRTLVNIEPANFNKFPQSKEAIKIDKFSARPETWLFEKEISGAYLFKHFNERVKNTSLPQLHIDSTKELTILAQENTKYAKIALAILEYSAELVAAQIAGIAGFLERDLTFIMEGSLFWEGYRYKSHVEETLEKLGVPCKITFKHVHNSTIVGAAKLVC